MAEEIISVGIDIGTSTMQLIFSKIIVENLAGSYSVPKISIIDKKIIYESPIGFTPMISKNEIDITKCEEFIREQYLNANINYKDIKSGAVIITGESARRRNADEVLEKLGVISGDFVVSTAGPSLESVLSGIGSSAMKMSKETGKSIANIDIGGGTSNISYFMNGKLKGTNCLDIGGRLIKVDLDSDRISYVYHKIKELAELHGITICEGEKIDIKKLVNIADIMANIIRQSIDSKLKNDELDFMITNYEKRLKIDFHIDNVCFSGGVGDCIYNDRLNNSYNKLNFHDYKKQLFKYGDIGIILAERIRNSNLFRELKIIEPKETLRATVIGAGMHTTEISGSTITVENSSLPLKNIPLLKVSDEEIENIEEIIRGKLQVYCEGSEIQSVAISFGGYFDVSFKSIQSIAEKIIKGACVLIENDLPLIVVVENDIGKCLGNALLSKLNGYKKVICIDNINTLSCDYIDIGKTIANAMVVPVVIKTLIFNT